MGTRRPPAMFLHAGLLHLGLNMLMLVLDRHARRAGRSATCASCSSTSSLGLCGSAGRSCSCSIDVLDRRRVGRHLRNLAPRSSTNGSQPSCLGGSGVSTTPLNLIFTLRRLEHLDRQAHRRPDRRRPVRARVDPARARCTPVTNGRAARLRGRRRGGARGGARLVHARSRVTPSRRPRRRTTLGVTAAPPARRARRPRAAGGRRRAVNLGVLGNAPRFDGLTGQHTTVQHIILGWKPGLQLGQEALGARSRASARCR